MFLSADVTQGNMQGMNPYAYVGGNPETRNDPTGQRPVPPGGGGAVCECTLTIDTNPPPPIKPILPGTPEWQSIGNIFAFGYRYGELVVLASIEAIVDAHSRGWHDGNTILSTNNAINYLLALLAQQYRQKHQDETPYGKANIALAYWWASDKNGNVMFGDVTDPKVGTNDSSNPHAEEQLVSDFIKNIAPNLDLDQGDSVHYVMYSEIHPRAACTQQLRSWANSISKAIGAGVNFNFDVFDTRPDSRYRDKVVSPTNTKAYYYYSYWIGV